MRSLILAGGGVKVGYQAGCLQVLMDEAKIEFDHVDGTSGGCLNAAMVASGMTGTQIADAWRQTNPWDMIQLNSRDIPKFLWGRSIGLLDGMKERVFPEWGLDFERIRTKTNGPKVTFNVFDFTNKRLTIVEDSRMDADMLCACIALPMWFPPVVYQGISYVDAVFFHDANVSEAVRRGADEIWAIWTVSNTSDYLEGFVNQYFHIVEVSANGHFFADWREISRVNDAIDQLGENQSREATDLRMLDLPSVAPGMAMIAKPPPGRKRITQHLIQQEVPLQYLLNVSQDRLRESIEMGIRDTREYCRGIGLLPKSTLTQVRKHSTVLATAVEPVSGPGIEFTETMKGFFCNGEADPATVILSGKEQHPIQFHVTIRIEDLDAFLRSPDREAVLSGRVTCAALSENDLMVRDGMFNLLIDHVDTSPEIPARMETQNKRMLYRMVLGSDDKTFLLVGEKRVYDDPGRDLWSDTTTLFIRLYHGASESEAEQIGAGILHIHLLDFVKELSTLRAIHTRNPLESVTTITRFGKYFMGSLWDVYARQVLEYAPF